MWKWTKTVTVQFFVTRPWDGGWGVRCLLENNSCERNCEERRIEQRENSNCDADATRPWSTLLGVVKWSFPVQMPCLGLKWMALYVPLCSATAAGCCLHQAALCSPGWSQRSQFLRLVLPALHTWQQVLFKWSSEQCISFLLRYLVIFHIMELTALYTLQVYSFGFFKLQVITATHTQMVRNFTGSCEQRPRGPVGFLNLAAPATFFGILLTLSSSVYPRLFPPTDLSGGSRES